MRIKEGGGKWKLDHLWLYLPTSQMQIATDGLEEASSKKRRASTDLSVEEEGMAPQRKMSHFETGEEVTQELIAGSEMVKLTKKPSRGVREAKKLHKERIVEAMKAICYATLQILIHLDPEKGDQPLPMLPLLLDDLAKPIDDAVKVVGEENLAPVLEGLKRRAVASIQSGFFSLAATPDFANMMLHHPQFSQWVDNSFVYAQDFTPSQNQACRLLRELFVMCVERASSPDEYHVYQNPANGNAPANASALGALVTGEDCSGITSTAIINGFKSYPTDSVKHGIDVALEDFQCSDGTIVAVLRATDCTRTRARGTLCTQCRLAHNRWAVRLCRLKKTKPDTGSSHQ